MISTINHRSQPMSRELRYRTGAPLLSHWDGSKCLALKTRGLTSSAGICKGYVRQNLHFSGTVWYLYTSIWGSMFFQLEVSLVGSIRSGWLVGDFRTTSCYPWYPHIWKIIHLGKFDQNLTTSKPWESLVNTGNHLLLWP